MKKIPVNIISGFLGSGKTTAIIKLLDQKKSKDRWAVIINEFGKISIDSQTLNSSGQAESIYEVSGGCICCSAKGYFKENLEKILQAGIFSRILIEPTGLGGIDMVSEIISSDPRLKRMPVICLVDVTALDNPRLPLFPIYRNQILKSDIILFSKCDLIESTSEQERLVQKFKSTYPEKRLISDSSDPDKFSTLLDLETEFLADENKFRRMFPLTYDSTTGFHQNQYIFEKDLLFNTGKLTLFFNAHSSIIRAKGHLNTKEGWKLVNFTLSGCSFEDCEAKMQNEMIIISENTDAISLLELIKVKE